MGRPYYTGQFIIILTLSQQFPSTANNTNTDSSLDQSIQFLTSPDPSIFSIENKWQRSASVRFKSLQVGALTASFNQNYFRELLICHTLSYNVTWSNSDYCDLHTIEKWKDVASYLYVWKKSRGCMFRRSAKNANWCTFDYNSKTKIDYQFWIFFLWNSSKISLGDNH